MDLSQMDWDGPIQFHCIDCQHQKGSEECYGCDAREMRCCKCHGYLERSQKFPRIAYNFWDREKDTIKSDRPPGNTSRQRFSCTEFPPCQLSFTSSEHLAEHIRKHTDGRPFQCICLPRFPSLESLQQHAQTVHANKDIAKDSLLAAMNSFEGKIGTDGAQFHSGRVTVSTVGSMGETLEASPVRTPLDSSREASPWTPRTGRSSFRSDRQRSRASSANSGHSITSVASVPPGSKKKWPSLSTNSLAGPDGANNRIDNWLKGAADRTPANDGHEERVVHWSDEGPIWRYSPDPSLPILQTGSGSGSSPKRQEQLKPRPFVCTICRRQFRRGKDVQRHIHSLHRDHQPSTFRTQGVDFPRPYGRTQHDAQVHSTESVEKDFVLYDTRAGPDYLKQSIQEEKTTRPHASPATSRISISQLLISPTSPPPKKRRRTPESAGSEQDEDISISRRPPKSNASTHSSSPRIPSREGTYLNDFYGSAEGSNNPSPCPSQQRLFDIHASRNSYGQISSPSQATSQEFNFRAASVTRMVPRQSSPLTDDPLNRSSGESIPLNPHSPQTSGSKAGNESCRDSQHEKLVYTNTKSNTPHTCTFYDCTYQFDSAAMLDYHLSKAHGVAGFLAAKATPQSPKSSSITNFDPSPPHASQDRRSRCSRINPSTGKPCNITFLRPYDLTRHEETIHHQSRRQVQCQYCGEPKTFSRAVALERHMRVVHPEIRRPGRSHAGSNNLRERAKATDHHSHESLPTLPQLMEAHRLPPLDFRTEPALSESRIETMPYQRWIGTVDRNITPARPGQKRPGFFGVNHSYNRKDGEG